MAKPRPRPKPKYQAPPAYCWGAQLQGTDTRRCASGHVKGNRHFKTKFCANCKALMRVPLDRVRSLSATQAATFVNNHSGGIWTLAASKYGGFRFRVVNNTHGCQLPMLIVFEDPLPNDDGAWLEVPASLQEDDGCVHLCVSKGTAVPVRHLGRLHYKPESTSPTPSLSDAEEEEEVMLAAEELPPVLCEVLVPSVVMNLPLPPIDASSPASPTTPSSSGESDEPVFASYNERRMHRNRQSAAKSRLMKRRYIESLEQSVSELEQAVEKLRQENLYLHSLRTVNLDDALCIDWSVLDSF